MNNWLFPQNPCKQGKNYYHTTLYDIHDWALKTSHLLPFLQPQGCLDSCQGGIAVPAEERKEFMSMNVHQCPLIAAS